MIRSFFVWLVVLAVHLPVAFSEPLPPARVTEVHGSALVSPNRPLRKDDVVGPGSDIRVSPAADSAVELTFKDGSLVRLSQGAEAHISPTDRLIELRRGRVLIQADRMLGGVMVQTPIVIFHPQGTTYLVEWTGGPLAGTDVVVLEGAVLATCPRPRPERHALVLPGEALHINLLKLLLQPNPRDLAKTLADPLIAGFSTPLPSRQRILDLVDQQRRRILSGRNERLRKEIHWQRPRHPIVLPELFRPGQDDLAPGNVVPRNQQPPKYDPTP